MNYSHRLFESGKGRKFWIAALAIIAATQASPNLQASVLPSGTITTNSSGSPYTYSITIHDGAATNAIGTVWFAWVPGQNYLATNPISETSPTGWTVGQISVGSGYGIQWVSSDPSFDIPINGSLTFGFTTTDAPTSVDGNSIYYSNPSIPVLTTTVYSGTPFNGDTAAFVVTAVPEPASLALAALSTTLLLRRRRPA